MSPGNRVKLFKPQSLPPNGIVPPTRPHLLNLCKCCHPLWTKCSNAETTGDVSHLIHSIELTYLPSTSLAGWSRISHFSLASLISCLLRYLLPCTPTAPSLSSLAGTWEHVCAPAPGWELSSISTFTGSSPTPLDGLPYCRTFPFVRLLSSAAIMVESLLCPRPSSRVMT